MSGLVGWLVPPGVKRWLQSSLAEGPARFLLLWGVPAGVLLSVLVVMLAAPVAPPDEVAAKALLSVPMAGGVFGPTSAETAAVRGLQIVRQPLALAFPPVLSQESGAVERMFGVTGDQGRFNAAVRAIARLEPTCGSGPDRALAAAAQSGLNGSALRNSRHAGLVAYHQGLLDLCLGDNGPAKTAFDTALAVKPPFLIGGDPARRNREGAQIRALASYGEGLALLRGVEGRADPGAADAMFAKALAEAGSAAGEDPGKTVIDFAADQGDLFNVSSAEIVGGRIASRILLGDFRGAMDVARAVSGAPNLAITHPSLAANLAMAAAAQGRPEVVSGLYAALRGQLGDDPTQSHWMQGDKPAAVRILAMAATTDTPIYQAGDEKWWPTGAFQSPTRQAFEQGAGHSGGFGRGGPLWFPPFDLAEDDVRTLDIWLWLRRDRDDLIQHRFASFGAAARLERELPPGDQDLLERARHQAILRFSDALMRQADVIRHRDGMASARPVLQLLAGSGFPASVSWPARLSLRTGLSAGLVEAIFAVLFFVLIVCFAIHRELRIGYRRTFPHRHYDQRIAAGGEDWSGLASAPPGDTAP